MDALLARLEAKRDRLTEEINALKDLQRAPVVPDIIRDLLQAEWLKLADVKPGATPGELLASYREQLMVDIEPKIVDIDRQKVILLSSSTGPREELGRRLDDVLAERERLIREINVFKERGQDAEALEDRKQELQVERDRLRAELRLLSEEGENPVTAQLEELKLQQKKLKAKRTNLETLIGRIERLASAADAIGLVLAPYQGKPRVVRPPRKKPASEEPQLKRLKERCDYCAKNSALATCSGCNTAKYCGRECQAKDYSRHIKSCAF
jgi:DNA repair exonuclease SbcCD ATPase subunit